MKQIDTDTNNECFGNSAISIAQRNSKKNSTNNSIIKNTFCSICIAIYGLVFTDAISRMTAKAHTPITEAWVGKLFVGFADVIHKLNISVDGWRGCGLSYDSVVVVVTMDWWFCWQAKCHCIRVVIHMYFWVCGRWSLNFYIWFYFTASFCSEKRQICLMKW